MSRKAMIVFGLAVLLINTTLVCADTNRKDATADKVRYQGLLREIRSAEADYHKVQNQAFAEAKNEGKASLETKSTLLALSDKRRRILDRLLLLSLRHGWEIPDPEMPTASAASNVLNERERVFALADQLIKEKFAEEARRIAGRISLPVISLPSTEVWQHAGAGGENG